MNECPHQLTTLELSFWHPATHTFPLKSKKPHLFCAYGMTDPKLTRKGDSILWTFFSPPFCFQNKTEELKCWDEWVTLGHEEVMVTVRIIGGVIAAPMAGRGVSSVWTTGPSVCDLLKSSSRNEELAWLRSQGPTPPTLLALTWQGNPEGLGQEKASVWPRNSQLRLCLLSSWFHGPITACSQLELCVTPPVPGLHCLVGNTSFPPCKSWWGVWVFGDLGLNHIWVTSHNNSFRTRISLYASLCFSFLFCKRGNNSHLPEPFWGLNEVTYKTW